MRLDAGRLDAGHARLPIRPTFTKVSRRPMRLSQPRDFVSPKSSSIHRISGDQRLRPPLRYLFRLLNLVNNQRPLAHLDPAADVAHFVADDVTMRLRSVDIGGTPTRVLCDLYWQAFDWAGARAAVGELHVLDVGCGTGRYAARLRGWAGDTIASYHGTDATAHADWDRLRDDHTHFFVSTAETLGSAIPSRTNVVVTQSAVEHFAEDIRFFEHLRDFAHAAGHPVLQIHLVPAARGHRLYRYHGVRQYTPRTLSKLSSIFGPSTRRWLVSIGGRHTYDLHRHFRFRDYPGTARPTDHDLRAVGHDRRLVEAYEADMAHPNHDPVTWALVLLTGSTVDLLPQGVRGKV